MRFLKTALFSAAAWAAFCPLVAAAPAPMSTATAADLIPHAVIRRDTFGVPHITADTDEAAAFAMGYAVAEDHAVEMGKLYLIARGDAARWFGPQYLEGDLAQKRMGNLEGARRALEETGDGYRRWLHGFVTGVNFYAARHRAELPEWFPTVTEADIIAFSHEGAVSAAVRPPRTGGGEGDDESLTDPAKDAGSNALAISGARSTTGAPILLANPHLRWTAQYWEAQIVVPGKINFYGSLTVGLAVLRAGFGETIGYAQTNNNVDLVDHYAVPLDPANPGNYVFKGKSTPFKRQTVRVEVLQPTGQVETVEREFLATDFGPVVSRTATHVIVSRSAGLDDWRFHEGFYELYFAKDLTSFMATMSRQLIPSSNFTYADADGNIQYLWNAALPNRPDQTVDYTGVVPGDDDRYFFKGIVPLSEVPRFLNPASGYVMNSNNPPWFATVRERLNPSKFPAFMEQGEPGLRPQQALHMLEGHKGKFSPDDIRKLKYTTHMLITDRVIPDLLTAGAQVKKPSRDLREGLSILKSWDKEAAPRSKGAVLFQAFWALYEKSAKPWYREGWTNDRVIDTPTGLANPAAALVALEQAVVQVREKYGAANIAWGEVNRFNFPGIDLPAHGGPQGFGLYTAQTFDVPEDPAAVHNLAGRPDYAAPIAGGGDGWVLMTNFTKPVSAQGVLAYGQSSNADSPHSRDQIALFADNKFRPIWFTDAEVKAHLEREYRPGEAADGLERRDRYVDSDAGVRVFTREVSGKNPSGAPLLLIHDAGAGGLVSFDLPNASVAAELARAGHPVILMSVRGWEKSTRPAALDRAPDQNPPQTSLDEAVRDIDAVVNMIRARHGQAKVAVIGWGVGATWAGAYTARHPDGVGRLVLLNPPGAPAPVACAGIQAFEVADAHLLRRRWDAALPEKNPGAWRDPAVAAAYVQRALRLDPSSDARTPASVRVPSGYRAEACGGKALWDPASVAVPVLLARGDKDDRSTPEDIAALQKALPDAKALSLKEATHFLLLDRPEHGRKQFLDAALAFVGP